MSDIAKLIRLLYLEFKGSGVQEYPKTIKGYLGEELNIIVIEDLNNIPESIDGFNIPMWIREIGCYEVSNTFFKGLMIATGVNDPNPILIYFDDDDDLGIENDDDFFHMSTYVISNISFFN